MKTFFTTVLLCSILSPALAQACSKPYKVDSDGKIIQEKSTDKLKNKKHIFRGLAYKTEILELPDLNSQEFKNLHYIKVYFKPIEILKSNVSKNDYAISYNGYIGGCAPPVLVGLEYLVTPPEGKSDSLIADKSIFKNSIGVLDIFNIEALPHYKPKLEEIMEPVRQWIKTNPE